MPTIQLRRPVPGRQGKGHRLTDEELSTLYNLFFIEGLTKYAVRQAMNIHPSTVRQWVDWITERLQQHKRQDGEEDVAYYRRNKRFALYRPQLGKPKSKTKLTNDLIDFVAANLPRKPKMTGKEFYTKFFDKDTEKAATDLHLAKTDLPKRATVYAALRIVRDRRTVADKVKKAKRVKKEREAQLNPPALEERQESDS